MSDFVTPTFRVSFPKVFTPSDDFKTGKLVYSIQMLFSKNGEDIKPIKKAMLDCLIEELGSEERAMNTIKSPVFKNPINDGDKKEFPSHKEHWYINTISKFCPGLVDQKRQPIIDEDQFYAGCYARAQLAPFYWERQGKKGVSFSLQHIQKVKDGEKFVSRTEASDVFTDIESSETKTTSSNSDLEF